MTQAEDLVQKSEATQLVPIEDKLTNTLPEMSKMIGGDSDAARRFLRIVFTDFRTVPGLRECTEISIMGAVFTALELNLEPVAGRAYILPFNNKRKVDGQWKTLKEAQFVLGYKGAVDLFYRHARSIALTWGVVHENDDFDFEKGSNSFIRHRRSLKDRGSKIAYWVQAELQGGAKVFHVMTYDECIEHGKQHSKTYDKKNDEFYKSSPWSTSEDSMCLKTVLVQLCKTLPLSVEHQKALQADESTRYVSEKDLRSGSKIIDLPNQTNWEDSSEEGEKNESAKM